MPTFENGIELLPKSSLVYVRDPHVFSVYFFALAFTIFLFLLHCVDIGALIGPIPMKCSLDYDKGSPSVLPMSITCFTYQICANRTYLEIMFTVLFYYHFIVQFFLDLNFARIQFSLLQFIDFTKILKQFKVWTQTIISFFLSFFPSKKKN